MRWKLLFEGMVVVSVILIIRLIYLEGQIQRITAQLKKHIKKETGETIKVSLGSHYIEELADQVNVMIGKHKQLNIDIRKHEAKLKAQIADISHDLKTPLSAVKGYVQLLETDNLTEIQRKKYLKIIEQKADVLNSLIHDFFELSVIDSDDYTLNLQKTDATSVVTNVLLNFYSEFEENNQKPVIEMPGHAIYLMADQMALQRIVQNLLSNAIRYSDGKIRISLKNNDGYTVFSIQNEAVSLSEGDAEHLFDRFYRADASRTGANAGLGLYIVKTLTEKMGGCIRSELKDGWLSISIFFKTDWF